MSSTAWLLVLFVVLPVVVAPIVIWLVGRSGPTAAPGTRTSELLRDGAPAKAELLAWKNKGPFLLDSRPMVAFHLNVQGPEPFELFVMQSVPRPLVSKLIKGMTLDVRVSADRTNGAVELSSIER